MKASLMPKRKFCTRPAKADDVRFINRSIFFINLGVIAATFLAYLAPMIDPQLTWIISFFGLFYPILLILNVLFIVFWLVRKPKYSIASILCILLGINSLKGFISFNGSGPETEALSIRMITYNISNAAYGINKKLKNQQAKQKEFTEFLNEYADTDIFCFQEVGDFSYQVIKKVFADRYLYYKNKGAVIVSRYPFGQKGEIDFGTITNSCLWADVDLGDETVRVYSFHLQSNQITRDAEKLANQSEIDQKQAWYDVKAILRKFRNRHLTRSTQSEKIAAHASKSPYRVILAGDLNDPPQSYTYRVISSLGKDAFREKGTGIGTTYAGKIPLLRIDYVIVDNALDVVDYSMINKRFSDHNAISTTISWPEEKDTNE